MLKKQQKKRLQCEIRITVFCLIKLSWVLYMKLFTPHRFPLSKVVSVGKKKERGRKSSVVKWEMLYSATDALRCVTSNIL